MAINDTLDGVQLDMGPKDLALYGNPTAEWLQAGIGNMCIVNTGEGTPSWFTPTDTQWKTGNWNAATAWWVAHAGANHVKNNTRINISSMKMYGLRNGVWEQLNQSSEALNWENADASDVRLESDGSRSYQFQVSLARMHGSTARFSVAYHDLECVYVRYVAKLVLDDLEGVDDRHEAEILANCGGDWWPETGTPGSAFTPAINPGIGNSGMKLITAEPRVVHFITAPTSIENDGYSTSPRTISIDDLGNNLTPTLAEANARSINLIRMRR